MGLKDLDADPLARDADDSRDRRARHRARSHLGYEANYAGTSFVKISDLGKLKYGSKLFNVTADRTIPKGVATWVMTMTV